MFMALTFHKRQNVFSKFGYHHSVLHPLFYSALLIKIQREANSFLLNLGKLGPLLVTQRIWHDFKGWVRKGPAAAPGSLGILVLRTPLHGISTQILMIYCKKPNSHEETTYRCSGWQSQLFQTFSCPSFGVKCQWKYLGSKSSRPNSSNFQTFKHSRSRSWILQSRKKKIHQH